MTKNIRLILFISILLFLGLFVLNIYQQLQKKEIADKTMTYLPHFNFSKLDNKQYSDSNITDNAGEIIINYFNANCEHCQYMAKSIQDGKSRLGKIKFLMITTLDTLGLYSFMINYRIDSLANITVLIDRNSSFKTIFGSSEIPTFLVYKNRILVRRIIGETKLENLLNAFN